MRRTVLPILAVVFLLSGYLLVQRLSTRTVEQHSAQIPEALPDSYPRLNKPAPDFRLVDEQGRATSLASFSGKPLVLTFAFAHCQTICPAIITTVQKGVKASDASVAVITLDPERDTPETLPELARSWNLEQDQHVLSGALAHVRGALAAYEMQSFTDGSGEIVHPALVYIIDRTGRIAFEFNNPSPRWLTEALARL